MAEAKKCSACGTVLAPDAPGGHCLHCLLRLGLALDEETVEPEATIRTPSPAETRPAEQPGDRIGPYKLLQQIGEGGMGTVWMAEEEEPIRRKVALKVVKLGMDTKQVVARFEAERQALALMDHPNIARVFHAGATDTGRPYFVMELVRGVKITDYCDQNNLSTGQRLELFVKVCQAIQHAHQKGIIHRDIKPSNILVTMSDGLPLPKVIDFGIAKATTDQRLTDKTLFTAFEQFIGTPAYMSPEQAEMSAIDIDTRSDIYSLGVLLYELLTSKTPFDAKDLLAAGLDAMRRVIREQEPPRPSTRLSTMLEGELTATAKHRQSDPPKLLHLIRGDLDWIVMKTLEKDRTRRYETANGLAKDIGRYLNNEPVLARPPSNLYQFQKLVLRNKLVFAAGGAVAAALLMGLGISTWSLFAERRALRRAVTQEHKSHQVAQFLKDMLQAVDPSVARSMDTSLLKKILDQTAERLGKELRDQPEVEADLRITIGEVYRDLGEPEKAATMFRAALALLQKLHGNENADAAIAMDELAGALLDEDKLDEAESWHRQALAIKKKVLGPENPEVAISMNNLGLVLWHQGKLEEAEKLQRETLALRRKIFGKEHPDVANSLNNLAIVLRERNQLADAEKIHREALAMRRKLLGNDHPDVTVSLNNLASVLWSEGRWTDAEALQIEAIEIQRKILGAAHPNLAGALNNLGTTLWNEGKRAEAEEVTREALEMRRKLLGTEHEDIALSLNNLAYMLAQQGKLADAETMHREALAMRQKLLGPEHAAVAQSMNNLALVLREEHRLAEAEDWQRRALAMRRKLLGNDHPDVAASLDNLAIVLRDEARFADAEPLTRECLASREKSFPEDWLTFNTRSRLGADLLGQKKYADAEPLLASGYEGMKKRENKIPADRRPRLREAMDRLVQLFDVTGRPEQAAEWRKKLTEFDEAEVARKAAGTAPTP